MTFSLSREEWLWAAGLIDGDGSVGMYDSVLMVSVLKSIKAYTTVRRLRTFFGGSITFKLRAGEIEACCVWTLRSQAARLLCQELKAYVKLKKPQFELASTALIGKSPISVTDGGVEQIVRDRAELSGLTGLRCNQIMYLMAKHKGSFHMNNFFVQRMTPQAIREHRRKMEVRLKEMKHEPHNEIEGLLELPYAAGFFDSEGTITIISLNQIQVRVPQEYPAILNAFVTTFGANLYRHEWSISRGAREFLQQILPFAFEKRQQLALAIDLNEDNWKQQRDQINALKGVCVAVGRRKSIVTQIDLDAFIATHHNA